jgi:hypothetical protein
MNFSDHLDRVKAARREAELTVCEGITRGMPMGVSHIVVQKTLAAKGLPIPEDILAFASNGRVSDADVTNWDAPRGGLDIELFVRPD